MRLFVQPTNCSGQCLIHEVAQRTAKGAYNHFLTKHTNVQGKDMYFYPRKPVVQCQMADNARYAWEYTRDENGFLGNDWTGENNKKFKWLLDNACMIELFAKIGNI